MGIFFFSLVTDKLKTCVHRKSISGAGRSHIINLKHESRTSHERYSRLVEKDDLFNKKNKKKTFSRTPNRDEMFFVCVERSEK